MDRRATVVAPVATSTTKDLLVSYPGRQYARARSEIAALLREFGDHGAWVEKTAVWGMAAVHASLDNREIIRRCRALWQEEPSRFRFAVKWIPVDYWCESTIDSIKALIDQEVLPRMGKDETWALRVHKRRWGDYTTLEIVQCLAANIRGRVDLTHPDQFLWVDVVGRGTAVSLLRPEEIFAPLAGGPGLPLPAEH